MNAVPLTVALLAGGLAVLNPCGFPVLSAFLAYNLGDDGARSRAPNQVGRGLITGLLVTIGVLAVFTGIGLPLSLGVAVLSDVVPWVGLAFGAALLAIGVATLVGRHIGLPRLDPVRIQTRHRVTTQLAFGVGYGVASLACTLPLFLALVGAGAGGGGTTATLAVFAAYGSGMAAVLMALAVGAALIRGGVTRWAGRVLPHMQPLAGVLLTVAGGYLVYFFPDPVRLPGNHGDGSLGRHCDRLRRPDRSACPQRRDCAHRCTRGLRRLRRIAEPVAKPPRSGRR